MTHPEKWYIPVTDENHAELNQWRLSKRTKEASQYDYKFVPGATLLSALPYDDGSYFYAKGHSITKDYNGYQEITLEQFRQITNTQPMKHPEKWYIPVTEENRDELSRWRQSVATSHILHRLRPKLDVLLSKHIKDGSYYASSLEGFKDDLYYNDYQEITLEQFRQITNSNQPMKHPEHWCIEATKENFSELKAWWEENADTDFDFQVGYTLMSEHPKDESKYYAGDIKNCIADYPQFVEISLEQFRQITNPTQTTMSKSIRISRELLNEYYDAATTPQKTYLTEHFKLDGSTTVKAIRGLHDMACKGWKPIIKNNHPDCFPEESKYFDFSEHVRNKSKSFVPSEVCESLGLVPDFIQVRNTINPETHHRSFYLSNSYKWELKFDGDSMVLIPTKK